MTTRRITRAIEDQSVDTRRDDRECDEEPQTTPLSPPDRSAQQTLSAKAITMHLEHQEFLNRVSTGDDATITPETAVLASKAWNQICIASGGKMPVPAACTGSDGQMLYSWDRDRHHLELEIIPGNPAEFFYRDRHTKELWGENYNIGDPIPVEAIEKFRLFESHVVTETASRRNSPAYLAAVRRRKCVTIRKMLASLAKKARRDDFEAFTFKVVDEIRELLIQLTTVQNEGNTREILRQIRDSFLDGGHERYRDPKARKLVESILKHLSEADELTPEDVDQVWDDLYDGGLSAPIPAVFTVEEGKEEADG
jgi:hypothetical protein